MHILFGLILASVAWCADFVDVTPEGAGLSKPRGMTVAHGKLWVADTGGGRVVAMPLLADGRPGAIEMTIQDLEQPFDVAATAESILVAESAGNSVGVFNAVSGERVGELAVIAPRAVTVLADGRIAVSSAAPGADGKVVVFAGVDAEAPIAELGAGQFSIPWGIAEATGGDLAVADMENKRIVQLRPGGSVSKEMTLSGAHLVSQLLRIGDRLLACESTAHRIALIDIASGEWEGSAPTGPSSYPQGLAVHKGRLYISLTGANRIAMMPLDKAGSDAPALPLVADDEVPASRPRVVDRSGIVVVCFGDSVTFGAHMQEGQTYPEQLQEMCDIRYGTRSVEVHNAGVGGNTSSAGLSRLDRDVLSLSPDFVVINFGLNDSAKTSADRYKTPPGQFRANLLEMVRRVRAAGSEPVLSTITPVLDELYFDRHPTEFYEPDGGLQPLLARYATIVREIASEQNVALADWHRALAGGEAELIRTVENSGSRDGVHPTPAGYQALAMETFLTLTRIVERR